MATVPPPKPPPPKPPAPPPANGKSSAPIRKRSFSVDSGVSVKAQRIVLYGTGGIGKTELASLLATVGVRPLFLDIGNSTQFLDVKRVTGLETWDDLRGALHEESLWTDYNAVVIDDLTKGEELASAWTVANVPHEYGSPIRSIEDYGWGKGLSHVYETFLTLLGDCDAHIRADRHVICIAHECTSNVPNPNGGDWIRYEPRLQSPNSGKNSIRHRVKEWCDHMFFVGFDTSVTKDGKAKGSGTRTIYPVELPWCMAKSRTLSDPIPYLRGEGELWKQLFPQS